MFMMGSQNPAHAGMNLKNIVYIYDTATKPRSRGDEPFGVGERTR